MKDLEKQIKDGDASPEAQEALLGLGKVMAKESENKK